MSYQEQSAIDSVSIMISTVKKIVECVNEDPDLSNYQKSTFYELMKHFVFKYDTRQRNSRLQDRKEIVLWQRQY